MCQELEKSIPEKIFEEMISFLSGNDELTTNQINKLKELFEKDELSKEKSVLEILNSEFDNEITRN